MLKGKTVVVGVCGSIAAYKAVEIVTDLEKRGADVYVIMTRSAAEFVTRLTFQMNTRHTVYTSDTEELSAELEALVGRADCFIVAPASSHIIAKVAMQIQNSVLSKALPLAHCPVIFAPNSTIYQNAEVVGYMEQLRSAGYRMIECGQHTGTRGKIAPPADIVEYVTELLAYPKDLDGVHLLVTAGNVDEGIDPLVYITNYAAGKLGYAIAREAMHRGARVTLVSGGHSSLHRVDGVKLIEVDTEEQMRDAVVEKYAGNDVFIKTALLSDYHTNGSGYEIKYDMIGEVKSSGDGKIVGGFWLAAQRVNEEALEKLRQKNMDFVVACDMSTTDAGRKNKITILTKTGEETSIEDFSQEEQANKILNAVLQAYRNR